MQDCLRALLAVLMNLTQNNPAGCTAVVDAGALAPVAALLAQMVRGGPKIKGRCWDGCRGHCSACSTCCHLHCIRPAAHQQSVPHKVPPAAGVVAGREELAVWLDELR